MSGQGPPCLQTLKQQKAPRGAFVIGRAERIRTSDPLLPKQVRYQAALQPDRGA